MSMSREDLIILAAATLFSHPYVTVENAVATALAIEAEVKRQRKAQADAVVSRFVNTEPLVLSTDVAKDTQKTRPREYEPTTVVRNGWQ